MSVVTAKPKQKTIWYLWPPKPAKESWDSDMPNEGICVDLDSGVSDFFTDYQGIFIVQREEVENTPWPGCYFRPTRNEQYLEAYRGILFVMARFYGKSTPWVKVAKAIVNQLRGMGWREVVFNHNTERLQWKK